MDAFAGAAANCEDDLACARRNYAAAIGCAEAGCAWRLGASLLLRLARVELRDGSIEATAALCTHALNRLKGVPLLWARADEANAIELLGDAHEALGHHAAARAQW